MNRLPEPELAKFYDNLPFSMPEGKGLLTLLETIDIADLSQIQRIIKDIMKNVGSPVLFANNYRCGIIERVGLVNRNTSEEYELRVSCRQERDTRLTKWIKPTSMYAIRESPRCAALLLCEKDPWNHTQICTITMPKSDLAQQRNMREIILNEMHLRDNYSLQ